MSKERDDFAEDRRVCEAACYDHAPGKDEWSRFRKAFHPERVSQLFCRLDAALNRIEELERLLEERRRVCGELETRGAILHERIAELEAENARLRGGIKDAMFEIEPVDAPAENATWATLNSLLKETS